MHQLIDGVLTIAEKRAKRQGEIAQRVNRWAKEKYGLSDLVGLAEKSLGCVVGEREHPTLVFTRPVLAPTVEQITFTSWCDNTGLTGLILTHNADSFCSNNPTKLALLKPTMCRNGMIRREKLACPTKSENVPLSNIVTTSGVSLVDYWHQAWLTQVGDSQGLALDTSALWETVLREATIKPTQAYELNGKARLIYPSCGLPSDTHYRPTADWFETMLLALATLGNIVLCRYEVSYNKQERHRRAETNRFQKQYKKCFDNIQAAPLVLNLGRQTPIHLYLKPSGEEVNSKAWLVAMRKHSRVDFSTITELVAQL